MRLRIALRLFITSMRGVRAPATVRWYLSKLDRLVDDMETRGLDMADQVTLEDLELWRGDLAEQPKHSVGHPTKQEEDGPMQPETVHGYARAAKTFFKFLSKRGYIQRDPSMFLELPPMPKKEKPGLSEDDRDKMLAAARGSPRDLAIMLFLADTACRVGGVAGLKLSDLDFKRHRAWVSEKGLGGGRKGRYVFFKRPTERALRAWLDIRRGVRNCDYVFIGLKRGGPRPGWHGLTENGIYQMLRRYGERCGAKNWNPHNWRHGAIRGMTRNNMPLQTLSQIAGHASESTTADIYGTLDVDALQQQHDRMSWIGDDQPNRFDGDNQWTPQQEDCPQVDS